nr:tyrosine-type recombinase/integrase [Paenibacillus sp. ISL-20]
MFRQFVAHDYGAINKDNRRITHFHEFNRERDTAIVSLILGSGLRLSEVAGINIEDLDVVKGNVRVLRKGNKEQYVYFSKHCGIWKITLIYGKKDTTQRKTKFFYL